MSEILRLYRGDAGEIEKFRLKKTDKQCLVGQGIYLTDSQEVAETYQTKGMWQIRKYRHLTPSDCEPKRYLTSGNFASKPEAYAKAINAYAEEQYPSGDYQKRIRDKTGKYISVYTPAFIRFRDEVIRPRFMAELESGLIEMKIDPHVREVRHFSFYVINKKHKKVGQLSCFDFPKQHFLRNTIYIGTSTYVDTLKRDFLELSWEFGFDKEAEKFTTREEYIQRRNYSCVLFNHFDYEKMRRVLPEFGIHGIEYPGGAITSGKAHRAFCIWDEDYVNSHLSTVK